MQQPRDGGGGQFKLIAATTANNVTIFNDASGNSWERIYTGPLSLFWAGCVADYVAYSQSYTDNSTNLSKIIAYATATQQIIQVPVGNFGFNSPQTNGLTTNFFGMVGQGYGSNFYYGGAAGTTAFTFYAGGAVTNFIRDFTVISVGWETSVSQGRSVQRNGILVWPTNNNGTVTLSITNVRCLGFNGFGRHCYQLNDSTLTQINTQDSGNYSLGTTSDCSIASGSKVLTSPTANFSPSLVNLPAGITVGGAGVSGGTLTSTVASWQSATQITLATAASTTVSGAGVFNAPFQYGFAEGMTQCNHVLVLRPQIENCIDQVMFYDPNNLNCTAIDLHSEGTLRSASVSGDYTHVLQGNSCSYLNARIETLTVTNQAVLLGGYATSYTDWRSNYGSPFTLSYGSTGVCTLTNFQIGGNLTIPYGNLLGVVFVNPSIGGTLAIQDGGFSKTLLGGTINAVSTTTDGCLVFALNCIIGSLTNTAGNPGPCEIISSTLGAISGGFPLTIRDTVMTASNYDPPFGSNWLLDNCVMNGAFNMTNSSVVFRASKTVFKGNWGTPTGNQAWILSPDNQYEGTISSTFASAPTATAGVYPGAITYSPTIPASGSVYAWALNSSNAWVSAAKMP